MDLVNLDPTNKGDAAILQAIKLIDDNMKLLDNFTVNNDFTVLVPRQSFDAKRTADNKRKELLRLIECAKKYNALFNGNIYTAQAFAFYSNIKFNEPLGLNEKLNFP